MANDYSTVVRNHGVKSLYHFTPTSNLESIFKYAIRPRKQLEDDKIKFDCSDSLRLDGHKDTISLSVSHTNGGMLYYKRQNRTYAVLELDPSCIYNKPCIFFSHNAATSGAYPMSGPDGFERLFGGSMDEFPSDPQAEIMCFDSISTSAIRRVIFMTEEDMQRYKSLIPRGIITGYDRRYFNKRGYCA